MKKKSKILMQITIGIICFLLTMVMFMQFKIVYETDLTSIETMREEDLQAELANWKTKYEQTEEKYKETIETLEKYRKESSSYTQTKKNLQSELEKLKIMLGTTDVQGEGITIIIEQDEETEREVDADELMIIVNYLRDAGAEAIEINKQRIVNSSYFAYINSGGYIKINGNRISAPYRIAAIGDPDYLKSSLVGTGGYAEKITSRGQKITFETKKKITISKYNGDDLTARYISD